MRSIEMYFEEFEQCGFMKTETESGIYYKAGPDIGSGGFRIIGDLTSCYGSLANMQLKKDYVAAESVRERYITLADYSHGESYFYQKKTAADLHLHGLNIFVNDAGLCGYTRIKAEQMMICNALVLRERFFDQLPFELPPTFWQDAARLLNPEPLDHSPLLELCAQIKNCRLTGLALTSYVTAKGYEALSLILEYIERCQGSRRESRISLYDRELIDRARTILEEQIRQPPSIRELSYLLGMNQQKLMTLFKQTVGTTIYGYVKRIRMERAAVLIKQTDLTIAQIAREVGYHGDGHFQQAFVSVYGITPGGFRKEQIFTTTNNHDMIL